jgi:hypothetical protein
VVSGFASIRTPNFVSRRADRMERDEVSDMALPAAPALRGRREVYSLILPSPGIPNLDEE